MAKKFLDEQGVKTLWDKTKDYVNDGLADKVDKQGGILSNGTIEGATINNPSVTNADFYGDNTVGSGTFNFGESNLQINSVAIGTYVEGKLKKGQANGTASLDSNGKVPSSQLPGYVDDVEEYSAKSSFPAVGESGKIYIDQATNKTYRWSGTQYVEISASIALGETASTAYPGDKGKKNADNIAALQTTVSGHTSTINSHTNSINSINTSLGKKLDKSGQNGSMYYIFNSQANQFSMIGSDTDSFDGAGGGVLINNTGIVLVASEWINELGTAAMFNLNADGTIEMLNVNKVSVNDNEVLDESMALTTNELNAILV